MKFNSSFIPLAILLLKAWGATALSSGDGLLVTTSSGIIQGFVNQTTPNVRQFLGVPYAEPPLGDLRFAKPEKKTKNGTVSALALPNSCMQQSSSSSTVYTVLETQFLVNGGQSEDCLYVSIWAPEVKSVSSQQSLPVFIYVPGGSFTSGGENSLYKIPDQWVQHTQSHIVVVMNYRVNVFGFPNAEGLSDPNVGLLDQRMAVEWTYENIAAFGGDPERMTLWGQSAGAASVTIYGYSYPENPIVKAIIADSGAPSMIINEDYTQTNFTFLAGLVGCGGLNSNEEISCVRKVPALQLENALSWYIGNGTEPTIKFTPVPDNQTVFSNWTQRALEGKISSVPMIIGSNSNEGAGFVSFSQDGPGAEELLNTTDSIVACPVAKEVQNRKLAGLTTYRYRYAGNFSNISPLPWLGAFHSSELPLLFGTHWEYHGNSTPFEWNVSFAMQGLWLSFLEDPSRAPVTLALEGMPSDSNNSSYFSWPVYEETSDSMVFFAENQILAQLVNAAPYDDYCYSLPGSDVPSVAPAR